MKQLILSTICALLFAVNAQTAQAHTVDSLPTNGVAQAKLSAKQVRMTIANQKNELSSETRSIQQSIEQKQKTFQTLKAQYDSLLKEEEQLVEELATQAHELKTIDGAIRTSAKQAKDYFNESLTTPEHPDRSAVLETILQPNKFPGLENIQKLLALYLEEMAAGGQVILQNGDFTAVNGQKMQGEVLRIGTFTTAFRTADGELGFLRPAPNGTSLKAVAGKPDWQLANTINDFFDGKGNLFPVDISNGAALQRLAQNQKSFSEWLAAGGLLVWPILIVGIIAALLIVERFIALSRIRANSDRNMNHILKQVSQGQWTECRNFCQQKSNFPTCRIINHTLQYAGAKKDIIENAFQEGLLKELPLLERFLPTLNVLAAIAPLLGLLGTVTGMINTFQIITIYGTGDPRMMSGGISEALVTTQLGLAVAVPIMLLHHILDRRVDKIVGDMEEKGTSIAVALMKKENTPATQTVYGDAA